MEHIASRQPVHKLLTAREWADFEKRMATAFVRSGPEPIPPKARQLPAFHEAQVRRFEAKLNANPDAMHQADWHEWMTSASQLAYPEDTPVRAYARFLSTAEGKRLLAAHDAAPPGPDVLEPQPQSPKVGKAMAKMDALAKKFVQEGTAATIAKGYVMVLEKEPSLYTEYLEKTT